jgi:hypothetical protein
MDRPRWLVATLFAVAGCATPVAVRGRAEVANVDGVHVLTMCESHRRYQVGVTTSNAAGAQAEVDAWLAKGSPVVVEVNGFESTLPSGWPRVRDTGVVSVGYMRPVDRQPCR